MAGMTFRAGNEFAVKLSRLASGSGEISKKAIYKAAKILADKIKENLEENLKNPDYVGKKDNVYFKGMNYEQTGDLLKSFGITPISRDKYGNWNTKIGFDGVDRKGVPNQLKARVMETGSSVIRKRPFVRPAVNATKNKVVDEMNGVIDDEIAKLMK